MLQVSRRDDGRLGESRRRIAVWTVVLACHVGLLMLWMEPVDDDTKVSTATQNPSQALQIRFLTLKHPSASAKGSITPRHIAEPRHEALASAKPSTKVTVAVNSAGSASPPTTQQSTPPATLSIAGAPTTPSPASEAAPDTGSDADGGFQDRLRAAQHGSDVHGVPGSDKALVQGIRLVDPMDQGIGAAARTAQRLFGIKSRQCIDVETWRSLTPQELSARHISPDEVDREDEKYHCNDPPGLHF